MNSSFLHFFGLLFFWKFYSLIEYQETRQWLYIEEKANEKYVVTNNQNKPYKSSPFWGSEESHYVIQEFLCDFQDIPKLAYEIRHFVKTVTM